MVADKSAENGRLPTGEFAPGNSIGAKNHWDSTNNPRGKSQGRPLSLTSAVKRRLRKIVDPATKRREIDEIADQLIALAKGAESEGVRLGSIIQIGDRLDGKPRQSHEVVGQIVFDTLPCNPLASRALAEDHSA